MSHFDVMVDQMYGDMLVSETLASNRNAEREVTADRKRSILIESESSVCPVALRPVRKEDERWIASLYLHPANRLYTRAPKATVQGTLGIHELESLIWEGVLSQFIIEDQLNQLPIGLMTAHKAEWLRQTLAVHALVEPPLISDSIVVEGIRHFVNYLLKCWPLRQIFFEYLEGAPIMPSLEKALTDNEECLLEKCGLLRDWVIDENGSARSLGIYVVPCDSRAGLVGCTIAEY
jgi:hypothetical protein